MGRADSGGEDEDTPMIHIIVLIVSQICLILWKRWRPRSYHLCQTGFTNINSFLRKQIYWEVGGFPYYLQQYSRDKI